MTVYESDVVKTIRGFKRALLEREAAQIHEMATRYLDIERALESQIAALIEQIARLREQGLEPTWSAIYRLERYQRLQLQLMEELARFNGWAARLIESEQYALGLQAIDNAAAVMDVSGWTRTVRLPTDAISGMVGIARDGSPLGDLLASSYPAIRNAMTRELIRSVALGRNPRETARLVRKATGIGLNRALTIARTEQMRVYNEASLQSYRSMGVTQYERLASYDDRTCLGCLAASGEILSSELALDDHPNGRCTAIPIIPGVEMPAYESAESWFARQSEDTQRSMMGPGRFDAWRSGAASWKDLATHTHDKTWGGAWVPTRVSDLHKASEKAA